MGRDQVQTGGATGSLLSQNGPYKILLVDDEPDNIASLKRLIRKDFEVFSAQSAEEALPLLNQISNLELILCDQRMPGIQGSEFLEKAKDYDPLVTRILLTGFSDLEAVTEAVNKGEIWRYISKPWEPAALTQILKEGAQKCRTERSLKFFQQELKKKIGELEAKDWSRGRLIHILLHEFRTAPLVLGGMAEIAKNLKGENCEDLQRFIANLNQRFELLEKELTEFVEEENHTTDLQTQSQGVQNFFENLFSSLKIKLQVNGAELQKENILVAPQKTHGAFGEILKALSQTEPPSLAEARISKDDILKLEIHLKNSSGPPSVPVPKALAREKVKPETAWRALFEPFVGGEDLLNHSKGLRLNLARALRHLNALGWRTEISVDPKNSSAQILFRIPTEN